MSSHIATLIAAADTTQTALREALGTNKATFWRHMKKLDKQTLLAVAEHLNLTYGTVLTAAMKDAGLIDDLSELTAGMPVYVLGTPGYEEGIVPTAAFFDQDAAERYRDFSDTIRFNPTEEIATVPALGPGALPPHIEASSATWRNRRDAIDTHDFHLPQRPMAWADAVTSPITLVLVATPTGAGIVEVHAEAQEPGAAHSAVTTRVAEMRAAGLLAAADVDGHRDTFAGLASPARFRHLSVDALDVDDTGTPKYLAALAELLESLAAPQGTEFWNEEVVTHLGYVLSTINHRSNKGALSVDEVQIQKTGSGPLTKEDLDKVIVKACEANGITDPTAQDKWLDTMRNVPAAESASQQMPDASPTEPPAAAEPAAEQSAARAPHDTDEQSPPAEGNKFAMPEGALDLIQKVRGQPYRWGSDGSSSDVPQPDGRRFLTVILPAVGSDYPKTEGTTAP